MSSEGQLAEPGALGVSEGRLLFLVSAVQFVNLLDFMMVMPLGPDFAKDLGIPVSELGMIGGSYTAAAALVGVAASRFLDRFDRRSALGATMLGLVLATALGGFSQGLRSLMFARVLAGAFGGPATSISLSIVADVIPPSRRGQALGKVMAAFSVASVFGVPAGLELARLGSWRTPFFSIAGMGALVAASAVLGMPKLRLHLAGAAQAQPRSSTLSFLSSRMVQLSLASTATLMLAGFSVIPNLSTYLQHNLGYPRDELGKLYLVGGVVSFVSVQLVGKFVDEVGSTLIAAFGTFLFVTDLFVAFVLEWRALPVIVIFVAFMLSMALRGVALNTLSSRVPAAHERARFMSLQSATQHLASAAGAILSSRLLTTRADQALDGMQQVAAVAIVSALILPFCLAACERMVRARDKEI